VRRPAGDSRRCWAKPPFIRAIATRPPLARHKETTMKKFAPLILGTAILGTTSLLAPGAIAQDMKKLAEAVDEEKAVDSVDMDKMKDSVSMDGVDYKKAAEAVDMQKAKESVDMEKAKAALMGTAEEGAADMEDAKAAVMKKVEEQ
jgi:hypothetical protein